MPELNYPLTDEQYVKRSAHCPFCGSDQIEGGSISVESTEVWQEVFCRGCCRAWHDIYKLIGYEESE